MTKIIGTKISASTKKTILVVDDDFDIAKVVKLWLQKKGFVAYEFTDPMLALKYFSNNEKNIDLILCDIRMPQMNGYDFVTKIKAIQPKIKVILMSAFEIRQEELSKVLPSIKIDGLVSKTISMKHLVESIKTHI